MTATEGLGAQFDFGRVISRTSGLVGRNFVPFFVLSFLFAGLPYGAIQFIQPSLMGEDPSAVGLFAIGAGLISFLTGLLLQGTLTRASIDDLSGKTMSLGAALNSGLAVMVPLFGLGLLVGLGVMAGLILLIVPGIILALRWSVAAPVFVAERTGILAAMGRSAVLTKNHRWAIFGLMVLFAVFAIIVSIVIGLVAGGSMAAFAGTANVAPPILFVIVMAVVQSVITMVATVLVAAIYFELRQVKEGVGVTQIAAVFE